MSLGDSPISVVSRPKTPADQDRFDRGLRQMIAEDPRLRAARSADGHTLISAVDGQHLDVVVDRLKREFQVEAGVGKPTSAGDVGLGPPDDDLS